MAARGNDTMSGGAGNDTYFVEDAGDKVIELAGQGIDTILTSRSFDLSIEGANVENLKAYDPKNYTLIGNGLNNTITAAEAGDDFIDGRAGNDTLLGGDGNDTIHGGAGNDQLIGGKGDDTLEGGAGNDTYEMTGGGTDTITELAGQGIDTIVTDKTYTLGANLDNLVLIGSNDIEGTGNELANVITGNGGHNNLSGLAGNDTLLGGDGGDALKGGLGKDVMLGGNGSDIYYVDSTGDVVSEKANEGEFDRVITTLANYKLGANLEDLYFDTGIAGVVGIGNALANYIEGANGDDKLDGQAGKDDIRGGEGNDTLFGGDDDDWLLGWYGDDTLDGGKGADTLSGSDGNDTLSGGAGDDNLAGEAGDDLLIGGVGNDKYSVTDGDDTVVELKNGGIDAIYTSISLTLGDNIENAFAQASSLTITGNALDNYINGLDGADSLSGGIGADLLIGGAGADTLTGGDGNDVLEGSLGVDRIEGGAGDDLIRYRLGNPGDLDSLAGDLITGFEAGKDKIDLYDLFSDFGINEEDVIGEGYLRLQVNGNDTLLQFDKDGGADGF